MGFIGRVTFSKNIFSNIFTKRFFILDYRTRTDGGINNTTLTDELITLKDTEADCKNR